ncbi:MAG: phosphoribosylanthranilate isomerase [Cyclobacteriaceae bacterium]
MKLKICGMKYPDNLLEVSALQPDYLGFIFYEKSPRYMVDTLSAEDIAALPDRIQKIGVFVNATNDHMKERIAQFGLNGLQLHGDESPEQCRQLQEAHYLVIKVFRLGEERFDFSRLSAYEPYVDYFLFDTQTQQYGGSGQSFNWSQLQQYTLTTPFFLSGGISMNNLDRALQLDHPQLFGLDVNSRFETAPGRKNIDQLQKLVNELRKSD